MSETRIKDLSAYRQPMVTSLGIIMGFILNFSGGLGDARQCHQRDHRQG